MDATRRGIFISYSREDSDAALQLAASLRELGMSPIFEPPPLEQPSAGWRWDSQIQEALDSCLAAVVLLSPALFSSHYASRELSALLRKAEQSPDFIVVPVMHRSTEPPAFLRGRQYIDARDMQPSDVATEVARLLAGPPAEAPRFQPTGPAEYVDRLRRIADAAESEELPQGGGGLARFQ